MKVHFEYNTALAVCATKTAVSYTCAPSGICDLYLET